MLMKTKTRNPVIILLKSKKNLLKSIMLSLHKMLDLPKKKIMNHLSSRSKLTHQPNIKKRQSMKIMDRKKCKLLKLQLNKNILRKKRSMKPSMKLK